MSNKKNNYDPMQRMMYMMMRGVGRGGRGMHMRGMMPRGRGMRGGGPGGFRGGSNGPNQQPISAP